MSPDAPQPPDERTPRRRRLRRLLTNRWLLLYLALLIASHIVVLGREAGWERNRARIRNDPGRVRVTVPRATRVGPIDGTSITLSIVRFAPANPDPSRLPLIMLHGSPSRGGNDFRQLGPELALAGYDCYAIDLPGFGASEWRTGDYSLRAHAHLALEAMDALGIERAHVLGWSLGGGSCLWMADWHPERIASVTLMASVGAQETEGSGDYYFEHAKYKIGKVLLVALPELIPHFGILGPRAFRLAWMASFDDSDQRPIAELMGRLERPTLILQGRHDLLVPDWAAEKHHELIGPSTLVIFDSGHMLPLAWNPAFDDVVRHLRAFLRRYDDPNALPLRASTILAPVDSHRARELGGIEVSREVPWWLIVLAIWIGTFVSEDLTIITVALLIVSGSLDWGVGLIGSFTAIVLGDMALWALGRFLGRRLLRWPLVRGMVNERGLERWARVFDKHTGKAVLMSRFIPGTRLPTFIAAGILCQRVHVFALWVALAAFLWTPFLLILTMALGPKLLSVFQEVFHGPWAIVAAIFVLYVGFRLLSYEATPQGRDRLKADLARIVRREFWPAWMFYLPLVPHMIWLAIRHSGPMTFSCANPGIARGGGFIGESKQEITEGLTGSGSVIVPTRLIEPGPSAERAARARELIEQTPELDGYPIVCKPDVGYKGYGMHIVRTPDELDEYFEHNVAPAQLQRYHEGPYEIGVLWARIPSSGTPVDEWTGEVFSATHKTFPVIEGDGKSTLERLIWDHPRYRMQAKVFLKRFASELDRVLEKGEEIKLGQAGNHAQGAMFTDGMHLITPQLEARIDEIARSYRDPVTGRGFDFGRFDVRYESTEALARGEGFGIIELNGTASESTSMYDPTRSAWWSYGLLLRHWSRLFRIGLARRREGVRPMSLWGLIRAYREARPHNPEQRTAD